jgi:hypothetical protein
MKWCCCFRSRRDVRVSDALPLPGFVSAEGEHHDVMHCHRFVGQFLKLGVFGGLTLLVLGDEFDGFLKRIQQCDIGLVCIILISLSLAIASVASRIRDEREDAGVEHRLHLGAANEYQALKHLQRILLNHREKLKRNLHDLTEADEQQVGFNLG